jgi:large conductance mechanosensitive channel
MMGGFKKFLLRGNIVDLAVAVVVGVAFNAVIHALIHDLIMPLIGLAGGVPNFSSLSYGKFYYGSFINAALSFLVIAAVIYYFVVVPANRITALALRNQEATERTCPECISDIPVAAIRCKFCTAIVEPQVNGQSGQSSGAGAHRHRATWPPRS